MIKKFKNIFLTLIRVKNTEYKLTYKTLLNFFIPFKVCIFAKELKNKGFLALIKVFCNGYFW